MKANMWNHKCSPHAEQNNENTWCSKRSSNNNLWKHKLFVCWSTTRGRVNVNKCVSKQICEALLETQVTESCSTKASNKHKFCRALGSACSKCEHAWKHRNVISCSTETFEQKSVKTYVVQPKPTNRHRKTRIRQRMCDQKLRRTHTPQVFQQQPPKQLWKLQLFICVSTTTCGSLVKTHVCSTTTFQQSVNTCVCKGFSTNACATPKQTLAFKQKPAMNLWTHKLLSGCSTTTSDKNSEKIGVSATNCEKLLIK